MQLFLELAILENVEAKRFLGWMFETGKGASADIAQAIGWYEKAKSKGDEWSTIRLGGIFEKTRAFDSAKQNYLQLAKLGNLQAAYRLGTLHKKYGDDASSIQESVMWLNKANDGGHIWAGVMLGHYMLKGIIQGGKVGALRQGMLLIRQVVKVARERGKKFENDPRFSR